MWYSYRDLRNRVVEDEDGGHDSLATHDEPSNDGSGFELDTVAAEDTLPAFSSTERIFALSECIGVNMQHIRESDYDDDAFEVFFEDDEDDVDDLSGNYLVLTDEEADEKYRSSIESLVDDIGLDGLDIDLEDYVDSDYCDEVVDEYYRDEASEMGEDELAKELLEAGRVELSDASVFEMKSKEDLGLDDDEEIDEDDPDNYEVVASSWELADLYVDWKRDTEDFEQTFWELGLGDGLKDDITYHLRKYHSFPSWFCYDALIDRLVRDGSRADELAQYDNEEREAEINGNQYFIYRVD